MKKILFILFFLLSSLFSQSPSQKPTDTPKDQVIRIKAHNGQIYCYTPNFTKGYGFLFVVDCRSATPARYDVFQRISWKVNGIWMCLSAPSSITGIDGRSTQRWDWLLIEPCSLNDANQRWIIKDNGFYTADGRFRIKDYSWYAFISKNQRDYYDHSLDMNAMKTWINTIATPGTISIRTFIGWSFVAHNPPQFAVYYIQNNQSFKDDVKRLFYNPDNGHIAQFDYANGRLYCMTSKQRRGDDWNWISWESCTDNIPKAKDNQYWEFFALNDNEGALRDKDGNFLRVTQYGSHWGVPYTAKPEYLEKDTTNSPKSIFVFDRYVDRWDRYVNANLGDSLQYCPAPGKNLLTNTSKNGKQALQREIRSLPPTFRVTDDWIRRFWEIATTAEAGTRPLIGLCGPCLIHSYQIIAELHENYQRGLIHSGGYFFDTAIGTNALDSFRGRFPLLARRMEEAMVRSRLPLSVGETGATRTIRTSYAMALIMFPDYRITSSNYAGNDREIRGLVDTMFTFPVGTVWIATFYTRTPEGNRGHAQPILRTDEGLMLIPTNTPLWTYERYRLSLLNGVFSNSQSLIDHLSLSGRHPLQGFTYLRFDSYENTINEYLSNNNCTGEGPSRRGNARFPRSSTINQCFSGRCAIQ